MSKYRIIGIEHKAGTSSKTQKRYDMDILHLVDLSERTRDDLVGNVVVQIPVSRDAGILVKRPNVGEVVNISFNRFGYVESVDTLKG